ncbi:hypothetical protein D8B26_000657 [Coccidioides posadasii str. Silveira]|uniref:Zn(2)-C6 fungal-type domain-containing protein n=1 Tax=Coccidioides posadasii (strain RMSCC 757 / Silveira) TaxID=443226 RepID=E9DFR8_COCPS|nr:conserved hypothetical protein [Coccidioides posadasii str. Silveira]QVM05949.1 hypothetical protein D8B26_000657 [Coccidioides posadasii str. Silveira]
MKATNRRRTKCFSGCWTCRSRRVKCDETTPLCQRCRQVGVQCEGYGIRLNWVHYRPTPSSDGTSHDGHDGDQEDDGQAPGTRACRRSLTYLGVSSVPRLSSPELDVTLRQIDAWSPVGESPGLEQGGFSVFPAAPDGRLVLDLGTPSPTPSDYRVSGELSATETVNQTDDLRRESPLSPAASSAGRGRQEQYVCPDAVPVAQTLLSLGWERDHVPRPESPVVGQIQSPLRQQYGHSPPRHLDVLSMPASQKRLMHHWVTFTSSKIVLLDEPHNPCRTMMLPMALKGLMSSSEDSNADVAIFHAICASAAFNLFELGGRANEQDRALALNHEQQAIRHLRHNLARADEHRDQSFAMAIMACIAVEAISGTTQRWRTHVQGGLAYLAKLHSCGVEEVVLSGFRRHMVSMAILCDFPVRDDLKSFLNDDEERFVEGLEFTFPYYGVSRSFLREHDRMNAFAATIATSTVRTPTLEKELDAFELQLYLNFPGLPPQDLVSSSSKAHGLVLHHIAKVFYYAGLVFFQRSIRHAAVATVQTLVELGVHELESIERVGKGELGCMMLWPVLVLGAECGSSGVQQRMRAWFRDQRKLGFRNLVVLEELVDAVWRARADSAADGRNVDWRDLIVLARFDVFRL